MKLSKNINSGLFVVIILFLLLYLFLPTQNSSIDAYDYAAKIKWRHDVFFPHHLLYNASHLVIFKILNFCGLFPDVLATMKIINAVFAASSLLIFYLILNNIDKNSKCSRNLVIVIFAGSSFGFMRFATENETYIIPIFWSLLSSYYLLRYLKSEKYKFLILCGIMASIASLFHQIQVLWYIGLVLSLFFFKKSITKSLILFAPSLLIPIVYYIAFKQKHFEFTHAQNLWQFALYDYYYGMANTNFSFDNVILGFVSLLHSFVQVNGIIIVLLKKSIIYFALSILVLLFGGIAIFTLFKIKLKYRLPDIFIKTHLLIFLLQLGFAVFSEGNAEFMVMLPILFILIINGIMQLPIMAIAYSAIAMLIWNISFGLFPSHYYDFQNTTKTIYFINTNQKASFVLDDDVLIQNIIYYKTGKAWDYNIYKSPASMSLQNIETSNLRNKIDSCLAYDKLVFTDCINNSIVYNRKVYLQKNENEIFFKNYSIQKIDSFTSFIGKNYFYKISRK